MLSGFFPDKDKIISMRHGNQLFVESLAHDMFLLKFLSRLFMHTVHLTTIVITKNAKGHFIINK